jgi:uncharacterized protein YjbJ (UPF0337 family)
MRIGTMELTHVKGFANKSIGLWKEIAGTALGQERWREEGESQQARAAEELKALRDEVKARGHAAKAATFEAKQRAAQRMKETA